MSERQCGTCTLCCKVMGIAELQKPAGHWCPHCLPGKGCGAYEARPYECREFRCSWLADPRIGEEWKPEKSKIVLLMQGARNITKAYVDPATPGAWRKAPYYDTLRRIMHETLPVGGQVSVVLAGKVTLLLPDGEHDLGPMDRNDRIEITKMGDRYDARVVKG